MGPKMHFKTQKIVKKTMPKYVLIFDRLLVDFGLQMDRNNGGAKWLFFDGIVTFAEGICVKVRRRKNTKSGEQNEIMSFAGGNMCKSHKREKHGFSKKQSTPAEKGSHENDAFRRGNMCKSAHRALHSVDRNLREKCVVKNTQKRVYL